jgi:hypothetical protein
MSTLPQPPHPSPSPLFHPQMPLVRVMDTTPSHSHAEHRESSLRFTLLILPIQPASPLSSRKHPKPHDALSPPVHELVTSPPGSLPINPRSSSRCHAPWPPARTPFTRPHRHVPCRPNAPPPPPHRVILPPLPKATLAQTPVAPRSCDAAIPHRLSPSSKLHAPP